LFLCSPEFTLDISSLDLEHTFGVFLLACLLGIGELSTNYLQKTSKIAQFSTKNAKKPPKNNKTTTFLPKIPLNVPPAVRTSFNHSGTSCLPDGMMLLLAFGSTNN